LLYRHLLLRLASSRDALAYSLRRHLRYVDAAIAAARMGADIPARIPTLCTDAMLDGQLDLDLGTTLRDAGGDVAAFEAERRQLRATLALLGLPTEDPKRNALLDALAERRSGKTSILFQILAGRLGEEFIPVLIVRSVQLCEPADDGIVVRDSSGLHWKTVNQVEDITIPNTLQGLLISRIDRLDRETRTTLQLASVVGRSFYHRVLEHIARDISDLDGRLETLQLAELILEAARLPELEYMFRHELTRATEAPAHGFSRVSRNRTRHRSC